MIRRSKISLGFAVLATSAAVGLTPREASAQQAGYTADRLILAPNPDDGFASMRPALGEKTRFFGNLTLDYIRRPLHISTITDSAKTQRDFGAPISNQVNSYFTAGAEVLQRFSVSLTMPVTIFNTSNNPGQAPGLNSINTKAAGPGDLRLDGRILVYTSDTKKFSAGITGTYFAGTGNELSFAGDGFGHGLVQLIFEQRLGQYFILDEFVGVHLRNRHDVGTLHFQNEGVFGVGLFIPLREGRVRVGGEIYGQTGISSIDVNGTKQSTFFKAKNTPVEWLGQVRVALDEKQHAWFSGGAGTLVSPGYSAPDFRVIAQIGYWFDVKDTDPPSPARRFVKDDERVGDKASDRAREGIPDAIDACPDVPEDHLPPDPNDGCPAPSDRDKDGIPDHLDKCPDVPEDKDGIDDHDGCPEDDVDGDGIPDVKDACPREPGQPSPDPKQNGCPQFIRRVEGSNEIQILKKIEFDTGKATIKPVSFPILDEVFRLMKASPNIKKVSIEGHTDSRGAKDMNMKLSDDRSKSVMKYLVEKGIDAGRLTAKGFGPEKPIDTNDTDPGRQKNRRVEFHITELDRVPPTISLEGKVAIITGASRGIGEQIALAYAASGAKVVVASRKIEGVEGVAKAIRDQGGDATAHACHTGRRADLEELVAAAVVKYGKVDILVNNAATNPHFGPMLSVDDGAWAKTFEVNLKGYFEAARLVVEHLRSRKAPGSIVNVASVVALGAGPLQGVYAMTKAAVVSMTRTLAYELGPDGIRVNAIAPGLVKTRFAAALIDNDAIVDRIVQKTPLGRYAAPEEIAGGAVFLASDAASFVTGHTLVIDGGMTLAAI